MRFLEKSAQKAGWVEKSMHPIFYDIGRFFLKSAIVHLAFWALFLKKRY